MSKRTVKNLFYITNVDNLPSIFQHGILSHQQGMERGISFTPIYNTTIVCPIIKVSH
ncbi:DarT ssDNA thymidine ADP-ribosyltransferase family protein [Thermosynechococcus sp.]|uniref:DarT ssDNA thymidine ADP-ribosyltransferase family protein n=1 Tax=Thermosynechococcus sp. TaxID=2814275 RepID=UPI00391BF32D